MTTFLKKVLKYDKLDRDNSYYPEETVDNLIAEFEKRPSSIGYTEGSNFSESHVIRSLVKSNGCLFAIIETTKPPTGLHLEDISKTGGPIDFRLSFVTNSEKITLLKRNKIVSVRKITKAAILNCTAFFPV